MTEHIGPSLICPSCLKELYQCFLFRKKCQSADEYFKTKTAAIESELWNEYEVEHEHVNVKIESLDYESNNLDVDSQSYEQTEEIIEDQFSKSDNVEDIKEYYELVENFEPTVFRRRGQIKQLTAKILKPKKNS